jgi:hypothetical protein
MGEQNRTTMDSPLELIWDWSYDIADPKLEALYKKGKREQWDSDTEIDWDLPVDPGGKVLDEAQMSFLQLAFFKRLSGAQREQFNAHYSAYILSQILHGEQGALMVAGQLTNAVPDHDAKLYVASQAMDEARHVEVFARYIRKLDKIYPVTPPLQRILKLILTAPSWEAKTVGMQVILEGLALASFINVRAATGCALLREALGYVARDEARHVAFGSMYLTHSIGKLHADDRAEVEDFALDMTKRFVSWRRGPEGMEGFDQVLMDTGIDPMDFMKSLHEEIAGGFKLNATPGSVHGFRGIIMPGLIRAGLVSDRVRPGYEEANIKLFDDMSLLDSIEQDGGNFAVA